MVVFKINTRVYQVSQKIRKANTRFPTTERRAAMKPLDIESVNKYVSSNIVKFHEARLNSVESLKLAKLLKKNPYLLKAKNLESASDLIRGLLEAFLSSSEEELFGRFLEGLAIYVAEQTYGGRGSAAPSVDLEFLKEDCHYIVSVKSGTNWGNSSQHKNLAQDLRDAVIRVKQREGSRTVESVLGICYGKTRTARHRQGYLKIVGQNFWYFVSGSKELYTELIEPIGHRAKEHNDAFQRERDKASNRILKAFIEEYCLDSGAIDWQKLVRLNCGNFDLDKFM